MAQLDTSCLGDWFEELAPRLVLYARYWLDAHAAQDAVQDVFIQLMGQSNEPDNIKAWLFRAVRNRAISRLRSRIRRRKREIKVARAEPLFNHRPDDLMDAREIAQMLEKLGPQEQEIIVLRIWGELTLQQIAEIVGLSVPTVFRRYKNGLKEIRQALEKSCTTKTKNTN